MFNGNKIYKIDKNGNRKRVFCFRGIRGLRIKFVGKNSTIVLHEPITCFKRSKVVCGNNCYVEIENSQHKIQNCRMNIIADNNVLHIGKNFSSEEILIFSNHEPNLRIDIGDNVMTAVDTQIRTTDAHAIYDINSKAVLNIGKNIKIGNHVWLATGAKVLKGVEIADNVVIGMNSIVTKNCLPNSVYAGVPAKKIKTNVNWDREPAADYLKKSITTRQNGTITAN